MSDSWELKVYKEKEPVYSGTFRGPVEVGRQAALEEIPFRPTSASGCCRLAIAGKEESTLARRYVLIEPLAEGGFQITNLSDRLPIGLSERQPLEGNGRCHVPAPALLSLGKWTLRLQQIERPPLALQSLAEATVAPGLDSASAAGISLVAEHLDPQALLRWLHAAMTVLQSAADDATFFTKAARAVVDLVRLDSSRVLLLREGELITQTLYTAPGIEAASLPAPSLRVLDQVRQEKRTFWEVPTAMATASLLEVEAVVAAPILDRQGNVIGALYADRQQGGQPGSRPITEVEAVLVEVLACGVAAGLARVAQEQAAAEARVRFEQFFTPELSRQLALHPDLLQPRDACVSVLFCDIRRFSVFSERLGSARTLEWVHDVLSELSACVLEQGGVLVDYVGDELLAMWGAPEEQPDHAGRACLAALAMQQRLKRLNQRWQPKLGEPMDVGIGINTGEAQVGNIGSRQKFKYGLLGNTVNTASRVQGATKYFRSRLLITKATQDQLDGTFATREVGQVRLVNIGAPVVLHELVPSGQPAWPGAKDVYEQALRYFESQHFAESARLLGNWCSQQPTDALALLLLSRAAQCLVQTPNPFDPVWVLPGK